MYHKICTKQTNALTYLFPLPQSSQSATSVTTGFLLLVFVDFTGPSALVVFGFAVVGFGAAVIITFAVLAALGATGETMRVAAVQSPTMEGTALTPVPARRRFVPKLATLAR
jgi:hypothetical protein